MSGKKKARPLERWELIAFCLALYDAVAVNAAYFFALLLRFDMRYSAVPPAYLYTFLRFAPLYTAIVIVVFSIFRLYNSLWEFASFNELYRILAACFITCGIHTAVVTVFFCRMPVSYYLIGAIGQLVLVTAVRFAYRFARLLAASARRHETVEKNAMIIGAGAAGQAVLRELKISNNAQFIPCCVIDDDPNKWGRTIDGVPIVGGRDVIEEKVKKYNISQILIAIPTLSMQERGRLLTLCSETGCALKTLPALYQLANGEVTLNKLKPVEVEDLLGRDPIQINTNEVLEQLQALKTLLTQYPAWYKVLACPTIPAQERDEAAEQALRGRVHPYVLNFVRLLIDHGRAEELEGCAEVYGVLYDEAHGILPVCAVTAVPLTPAQSDRLTRRLQDASGKTIRLKNRVDPACMGGVRLELAGRSIDGSVRAQLESLRRQLMADLA